MTIRVAWKQGHDSLCRDGDALKQNEHVCKSVCVCVSLPVNTEVLCKQRKLLLMVSLGH